MQGRASSKSNPYSPAPASTIALRLAAILTSWWYVPPNSTRQTVPKKQAARTVHSCPCFGQDIFLESFNEFTHMLSVNAHGGALALAARVGPGQSILLVNKSTGEEQECRVVDVGSLQDGKWTVGIELVEPSAKFWKINFPPCAQKQVSIRR